MVVLLGFGGENKLLVSSEKGVEVAFLKIS
jgi:hypothetical protein